VARGRPGRGRPYRFFLKVMLEGGLRNPVDWGRPRSWEKGGKGTKNGAESKDRKGAFPWGHTWLESSSRIIGRPKEKKTKN